MKLLLTAIFKDDSEIQMATRMLESFMPYFDGLAVAITGTSGKTQELKALITKHKGKFVRTTPDTHPDIYFKDKDSYIFANFAEARNVVFNLASEMQKTDNYDYWSWADVDDVLISGEELKDCAKRAHDLEIDMVFFTYWYSVKQDKTGAITDVVIDHLRERLLRPDKWKWVSNLHEVALAKDDNWKPRMSNWDLNPKEGRKCVWVHLPGADRPLQALQRNIKILELQRRDELSKGKNDPRTIFYLAKTYYDIGKPEFRDIILELLKEYLDLSGWAEERANAWEYMGNLFCLKGDHKNALEAYYNCVKEYPDRIMQYLLLSKEYMDLNLMDECKFWLNLAMKLEPPQTRTTIGNPADIKVLAASIQYNLAIREQRIEDAIKWIEIRNTVAGAQDDGLIKTLKEAKLLNDAGGWVFNYAKWLKDKGHIKKIPALLASLPIELGREAFAYFIANEVNEPKKWGDKEIAYYASFGGEHFEQWSGNSVLKGIGGSETAVIRLAEEWAKKGWKVTVYGDPREDAGEINGVTYKPYYEINWKDEFNILILWRSPYFLDRVVKANKLFVDLHDVASQLDWTDERMNKATKVFVKSNYHRKMLPKLADEKVEVISNGI